jgi:hypothetical protein
LARQSRVNCIAKLLRRSVENPWMEYSLKKNGWEKKWKGGKGLLEPLGGRSRDFPRVYGEPLKSIRYWRGLFQNSSRAL